MRDIISQRSPPIPPSIPKPKKTACPDTFLSTFTDFSNPRNRSEHRWNTLRFYTGVLSPKPQKTPDATPITPSGSPMVCGTPTAPEAAATTRTSSPPPALVPASFFGIFSRRAQSREHRSPVRLQPLLSHPQDVSYRVLNCCGCLFPTRHRCDLRPNKTPPKGNIFTFSTLHRRHFALTLSPSHGAECAV